MSQSLFFLLDGKTPVRVHTWDEWVEPFQRQNRVVAESVIGDARVSTVFLGINHSGNDNSPVLFETLVDGGVLDELMWRYHTWEDAEAGHQRVCALLGAK